MGVYRGANEEVNTVMVDSRACLRQFVTETECKK